MNTLGPKHTMYTMNIQCIHEYNLSSVGRVARVQRNFRFREGAPSCIGSTSGIGVVLPVHGLD